MSRRREKRRAYDKKGSNRSWCRASPGDEMFSEGQIFMAVPTMKPIYLAGTRAADTPPQWLLQSVTLQQYWFGLTVLKLALYSHQEPKYWLSPPRVAEHFALFHANKRFCPDPLRRLLRNASLQPYLKDTGLQRGEKVQQGTPSKALIFSD